MKYEIKEIDGISVVGIPDISKAVIRPVHRVCLFLCLGVTFSVQHNALEDCNSKANGPWVTKFGTVVHQLS